MKEKEIIIFIVIQVLKGTIVKLMLMSASLVLVNMEELVPMELIGLPVLVEGPGNFLLFYPYYDILI